MLPVEGMEETLGHRLVPTVTLPAPPGLPPMPRQELPIAVGPILPATVRRHDQARPRLTLADGHRHGLVPQRCSHRIGHRPPDDYPRAEIESHSARQPSCARRQVRHIPNGDGIGFLPRQRAVELVRCHGLALPRSRRRCEPSPCFAAEPCLGKASPYAAAAALQSLLCQEILDPARTVGATTLGKSARHCVLPLLRSLSLRPRWAATPRVIATTGDRQEPPQATHAALRGLLRPPGVLYGSGGAKYAAAFFKMSRSSLQRTVSFRRRFNASESCSSWDFCSLCAAR